MVTPKEFIKSQMDNVLQLDGAYFSSTKSLNNVLENLFNAVFNKATRASVQQCLLDIEEE